MSRCLSFDLVQLDECAARDRVLTALHTLAAALLPRRCARAASGRRERLGGLLPPRSHNTGGSAHRLSGAGCVPHLRPATRGSVRQRHRPLALHRCAVHLSMQCASSVCGLSEPDHARGSCGKAMCSAEALTVALPAGHVPSALVLQPGRCSASESTPPTKSAWRRQRLAYARWWSPPTKWAA